jgi:FkbM family methyltransferase
MMVRAAARLRDTLPPGLRRGIFRWGRFFGLPAPGSVFPSVEGALLALRRRGFSPRTCVDVGAYRGEWTRMFRDIFPAARVLMVEAQEPLRAQLAPFAARSGGAVEFEIGLLGPADGLKLAFHEMETGSSVFAESSSVPRRIVERESRTLDALLAGRPAYRPLSFLKLDVQGYELQVLEGARETLASTEAVLLEASLVPINAGCPLVAEVLAYLQQRGFRLVDFCSQIRRTDGVLWQTDLLLLHERSAFLPDPSLTPSNWSDVPS